MRCGDPRHELGGCTGGARGNRLGRPHPRRWDERPFGRETGHHRCRRSEISWRVGGPHVERDRRRNGARGQAGEVDQQYADGLDTGFLATEAEDRTVRVRRRSRRQGGRGRTYRIRLAWSRSISALSRTAARCNSSAALYPLWNCTSFAGSFARLNSSRGIVSPRMGRPFRRIQDEHPQTDVCSKISARRRRPVRVGTTRRTSRAV